MTEAMKGIRVNWRRKEEDAETKSKRQKGREKETERERRVTYLLMEKRRKRI